MTQETVKQTPEKEREVQILLAVGHDERLEKNVMYRREGTGEKRLCRGGEWE